ncbi:hypothetical protein GF376_01180 [Candidatus Peregrinibacteria bacterium]|nr:hypothetical protein [Candidatus Peregrinibacteria bacterium]
MPLPEILNIGFKIDEEKLWQEDIPTETINLSDLDNNLSIPYLEQEGTDDWNLSPQMLLDNFEKEISHAEKVLLTDLSYPIEIYFHQNQWIILDGVHRFTKAHLKKAKTIKIRRISKEIALRNCRDQKQGDAWDQFV